MQNLESTIKDDGGVLHFDGFALHRHEYRQRKEHHKFVTDHRDTSAIHNEIADSLVEFVSQRFEADEKLLAVVKPFVSLSTDADIKAVHSTLCPDLDLQSLSLEYDDLIEDANNLPGIREKNLRDLVCMLTRSAQYSTICIVLTRLLAAKPHSADVERLISASNNLKSVGRSSMKLNTENLYLFIHYNMPVLSNWDPKPAVIHWMNQKRRRVRERTKGKQQPYFKGLFTEAHQEGLENNETEPESD